MKVRFKVAGIIILVVLLGLGIYVIKCVEKVGAGYAGVVYSASGGVEPVALGQGYHWLGFTQSLTEYPISTETVKLLQKGKNDESFSVATRDGKNVSVDTTYSYHMDITKLPQIYTKFRGADTTSIEAGYIKIALQKAIQNVTSTYGVLDLYGEKRDEITNKITANFTSVMEPEGIIIEQFSFAEIRPDDATLKSIQAIVDTQNEIKNLELQKQKETIEAERKRIEAQGIADSEVIKAEGTAKANEALRESLTPELVEKMWIDKWDGKQPQVSGGNTPMIQLPTSSK
jgi:regulator of protease activity HflC (stomatin/prohibitin superfamily)